MVLRSASPLRIDQRHFDGQIKLILEKGSPAPMEKWFWYGNFQDDNIREKLQQAGISANLWPIGLTLAQQEWQPRHYRLLVKVDLSRQTNNQKLSQLKQLLPYIKPVIIELPARKPEGSFRCTDPSGQTQAYSSQIEIQSDSPIELVEAPVGKGFHWENSETLQFGSPFWVAFGSDGKLCAGADVALEDYLASVNSSEMPADSPLEFLKAQVVAARSWLLANWGSHHPGEPYIICGGDHCQCYYGLSRLQEASRRAAGETEGEVLLHQGSICDARYAKSCGGVTEPGENVWAFVDEPYLTHLRDLPDAPALDLSQEDQFRQFQNRSAASDACCAPGYAPLVGKLAELAKLYRWVESISDDELGEIINRKTGHMIGRVREILPVHRGPSGRLIEILVIGAEGKISLTPELTIRYALSPTHLPSSAFWVERQTDGFFTLNGLGWGHGVGMCQIGAAALAAQGGDYLHILQHYFPGTSLQKIY